MSMTDISEIDPIDRVIETPELLSRILHHVGGVRDLLNAALVSRTWKFWADEARWETCAVSMGELDRSFSDVSTSARLN